MTDDEMRAEIIAEYDRRLAIWTSERIPGLSNRFADRRAEYVAQIGRLMTAQLRAILLPPTEPAEPIRYVGVFTRPDDGKSPNTTYWYH